MEASILDLRYKMKDVLQALDRREKVRILYHGKEKGTILPLTEKIGHRASIYVEEYSLGHGMRAGDALIAATATENNLKLATSNGKHFKPIQDLDLKAFKSALPEPTNPVRS